MKEFFAVLLFLVFACGCVSSSYAENLGEYGKADVEVDRSVLKELEGYQPPPMFGGLPSQKIEDSALDPTPPPQIPPPERPSLTAPKAEALLQHPVENHHVLTLQRSVDQQPDLTVPQLPVPSSQEKSPEVTADIIPIPPKKPKTLIVVTTTQAPSKNTVIVKPEPDTLELPPLGTFEDEPENNPDKNIIKPIKKAVEIKLTPPVNAYKPTTPKTMPAVPPVKVESDPLPVMGNLPPIVPEKVEKPSIGERMMDNALTRHMVKDENDVKSILGIPNSEGENLDLDQFSLAFKAGIADLDEDQKSLIKQKVVPRLLKDQAARLQILAYASRTDGTESSSRRISLSRALSARSYLLENGIKPTRIDVRALSDKTTEPPVDRIDVTFTGLNSKNY